MIDIDTRLTDNRLQANGTAIELCGPYTGHTVKPIAYCESPEAIVAAIRLANAAKARVRAQPADHDQPYTYHDLRGEG